VFISIIGSIVTYSFTQPISPLKHLETWIHNFIY